MITQEEEIQQQDKTIVLKVAGGSAASRVAGAVVKYMTEGNEVTLLAMGAGAVNQAVKAICIARGFAAPKGWNLKCIPGFKDEDVDGVSKTAICFYIEK